MSTRIEFLKRPASPLTRTSGCCRSACPTGCRCTRCMSSDPMPSRTICHCFRVTEAEIVEAVEVRGCASLCDVMRETSAGQGCTACQRRIAALIRTSQAAHVEVTTTTVVTTLSESVAEGEVSPQPMPVGTR